MNTSHTTERFRSCPCLFYSVLPDELQPVRTVIGLRSTVTPSSSNTRKFFIVSFVFIFVVFFVVCKCNNYFSVKQFFSFYAAKICHHYELYVREKNFWLTTRLQSHVPTRFFYFNKFFLEKCAKIIFFAKSILKFRNEKNHTRGRYQRS